MSDKISSKFKNTLNNGDIVKVHNTNWNYTARIGNPFIAIVVCHGYGQQPLLVKKEDVDRGKYNPFWGTYESIVEIKGNIDLAKLISRES